MRQVRVGELRGVCAVVVALALGACGPGTNTMDTGTGGTDVVTPMPDATNPMMETGPGDPDVVTPPADTMGSETSMPATCGGGLGPCNPVTNTGCMTGQACVGLTTTQCVPAGAGGPGTACMDSTDCREGLACLGESAGNSTCQRLCCGEGDDERCRTGPSGQPGARCNGGIRDSSLFFCTVPTRCDVFEQNCPAGRACTVTAADGTTDCYPAGTPTAGQPCGGTGGMNCAAGAVCLVQMGSTQGMCYRYCDPAAAGTPRGCLAGNTCQRATGILPNTIGICAPSM